MRDPTVTKHPYSATTQRLVIRVKHRHGRRWFTTPKDTRRQASSRAFDSDLFDMSSDCEVIRASSPSMATLRSLPASANLLLFTPVALPSGTKQGVDAKPSASSLRASSIATSPIDPFEAFGRALSQHHHRIRHVPYVPIRGFTATHEAFLQQADAVVVVNCQPADRTEAGQDFRVEDSLSVQADFAERVLQALDERASDAGRRRAVPLLLVQFGDDEERSDVEGCDNVFQAETYSAEVAKGMARLLFARPTK